MPHGKQVTCRAGPGELRKPCPAEAAGRALQTAERAAGASGGWVSGSGGKPGRGREPQGSGRGPWLQSGPTEGWTSSSKAEQGTKSHREAGGLEDVKGH